MFNSQWWKQKWDNVVDFTKRDITALKRVYNWNTLPEASVAPFGVVANFNKEYLYTSPYSNGIGLLPEQRDPNQYQVLYNPAGRRMVFAQGRWQEDDPSNWAGNYFAQTWYKVGTGFFRKSDNPYLLMDNNGNYLDEYGQTIPQGSYQWLKARYGSNPPVDVLSQWSQTNSGSILPVTDYTEADTLDYMEQQANSYDAPGLVKLGKPPIRTGDTFYINGQKAIMGTPDKAGVMQYAVTQNGEGDRWKYKIEKDPSGNWVRVYFRTYGAKKEKQMEKKKK